MPIIEKCHIDPSFLSRNVNEGFSGKITFETFNRHKVYCKLPEIINCMTPVENMYNN